MRGRTAGSGGRTSGLGGLVVGPLSVSSGVVVCSRGRTSGSVVLEAEVLSASSGVVACVPSRSLAAPAGAGTTPVVEVASSAAGRTSGIGGDVGAARKPTTAEASTSALTCASSEFGGSAGFFATGTAASSPDRTASRFRNPDAPSPDGPFGTLGALGATTDGRVRADIIPRRRFAGARGPRALAAPDIRNPWRKSRANRAGLCKMLNSHRKISRTPDVSPSRLSRNLPREDDSCPAPAVDWRVRFGPPNEWPGVCAPCRS